MENEKIRQAIDAFENGGIPQRRGAVLVLGQSKDPDVFPFVVKALEDKDAEVRQNALEALAFFGSLAVDVLVKELRNPRNHNHNRIIEILGEIHERRSFEILCLVLKQAIDPLKRVKAADSLLKFGPEAREPLVASLGDNDYYVRLHAIDLLVELGDKSVVVHVRRCFFDQSQIVRKTAEKAVEKLTTPQKGGLKFVVKED